MFFVTFLAQNMAVVYTEDTLKALIKTQLIDLFLKVHDQTNSIVGSLMREMKYLNYSFKRLEFDIQIAKTINNNTLKQLEDTGRQCRTHAQYLGHECVEIIGI